MEDEACIMFPVIGEPRRISRRRPPREQSNSHPSRGNGLCSFASGRLHTGCTTEFLAFAQNYNELQALNVQLIGLSVDSNPPISPGCTRLGEDGVTIPFPIIADLTMKVAKKYGMIHPDNHRPLRFVVSFSFDEKVLCGR